MGSQQMYNRGDKVIITKPDVAEYQKWYDREDPHILWFGITEHHARKDIGKICTVHNWYNNIYGRKDTYHYALYDEDDKQLGYVYPWWMLEPYRPHPEWEV